MNRRDTVTALLALGSGAPFIVRAQAQKRMAVVGILSPNNTPSRDILANDPFDKRLRELGWIEGQTLRYENAYGEGREDRLPDLAAILVAKKVDVIWAAGPYAAIAAARATTIIPIVFHRTGAPVEMGLVDSLARPGRNSTGVAWFAGEGIYVKRYQILRELAPNARRLAILYVHSDLRTMSGELMSEKLAGMLVDMNAAIRDLGFETRRFTVVKSADLEPAFGEIVKWRADSLSVPAHELTGRERVPILAFARRHRLISAFETSNWVQGGGLLSYGIVYEPTLARTADYIDRILRGARPADLPVELPARHELVVNIATARALGLKVPQSILLRADRVVE